MATLALTPFFFGAKFWKCFITNLMIFLKIQKSEKDKKESKRIPRFLYMVQEGSKKYVRMFTVFAFMFLLIAKFD